MDFRIVEKPAFKVVGKGVRVCMNDAASMSQIPKFWETCLTDGTYARLAQIHGPVLGDAMLGVCTDFAVDTAEFTYMIAAEESAAGIPEGMVEKPVPAATWAVFESKGPMPGAIQAVWGCIMSEFLPSGEYEHDAAPDLEIYPPGDTSQPDYRAEVWVSVVKKQ